MAVLTVTINQGAGQNDPTNGSSIVFHVQFREAVTGFNGADIFFTGSTASGTLTANVTDDGDGANYTVSVSGMTSDGTVLVDIPADAAQDAAGNTSAASTSGDN